MTSVVGVELEEGSMSSSNLSAELRDALRCPACRHTLVDVGDGADDAWLQCGSPGCARRYPVVDGTPVLIADDKSVFAVADYERRAETTFRKQGRLTHFVSSVIPELGTNFVAEQNYRQLAKLLEERGPRARILVVGSGETGRGMDPLLASSSFEIVNTDVALTARPAIVCDSHDLPFADGVFDGVVIQAVLEHVADPPQCASEVHRVLRDDGILYAETPFIQQVHGGAYDFTRYTHLGHRRLFRHFDEIASGSVAGAGTALAWSYQYFLLSFVTSAGARLAAKAVARLTAFWLKYFDYFLLNKPGTLDAASGYYFLGRKASEPLSDRDLIGLYRGAGAPLPSGS